MSPNTCTVSCLSKAPVLVPLLCAAIAGAAEGEEHVLGGSFSVGSDYTFRGVSQTMGGHAIQASVDLNLSSGLYAYVWGSNVDFVPDDEPDDGASREIDLVIGYATDIGDAWNVDLALIRYVFPGTANDVNYDYNEFMASVWYADTYGAAVAFSGNVDGTGAESLFYKLNASFDLPSDMTLDITYGYHDLSEAYGAAYSYTEAALGRRMGSTAITLAYSDTHRSADLIYDERATGPRLVLSLQIDW